MTIRRYLLHLSFWTAVVMTFIGSAITFYPGAQCGWFLLVAALATAGVFIPGKPYRIPATVMLVLALSAAYEGYQHVDDHQRWLIKKHSAAARMTKPE